MTSLPVQGLLWVAAISGGLMAGTYLAFTGFIMRSFASLPVAQGVAAMNAINHIILKSSFMPLFFGSTGVFAALGVVGAWHWGEPGAGGAVAAGLVYVVGMFVVTAFGNVPLNNRLARVGGHGAETEPAWADYLTRWTRWNTLRAVASTTAFALCIVVLVGN